MTVRETVRDYQRRLSDLDSKHSRAKDRLDAVRRRRAEVVEMHDQEVASAERQVEAAVVAMAMEVGAELTANLLAIKVGQVRRLLKHREPGADATPAAEPAAAEIASAPTR